MSHPQSTPAHRPPASPPLTIPLKILALTALAPAIWGSTYIVTTQWLTGLPSLFVALMRALPTGLLLLALVRRLPTGLWWGRVFVLGALNFTLFWWMLFVSAYRLPGGVAATIGATQPLIVYALARLLLGTPLSLKTILAALAGLLGVAALILTPAARLDLTGIIAGFVAALSMAAGTVLSRRWQPPVPPLTFTAWQLSAGGVLLLPLALWPQALGSAPMPTLTVPNLLALAYLGLIGAGLTYLIWFRGLAKLGPATIAPLGFFSPLAAVLLGWTVLDQRLTPLQIAGAALVLASVWYAGRMARPH